MDKVDRLAFDIDLRCRMLWAMFKDVEEWDDEIVSQFIRTAYALGYEDALKEDKAGARGKLHSDNGYRSF